MRVLLVGHGYPPRENAGTEQHMAQLALGLRARGHLVHVLAATRAPGRRQYEVLEEEGVTRIVNNVPARPLAMAERDRAIETLSAEVEARVGPELVHVHHLQFLSSGLCFQAPTVVTLHDQWAWCAAGGLGLLPDGRVCPGPSPARCASCASTWRPTPGPGARALIGVAGVLSPVVAPERLHALYQRLPERLRARARRGQGGSEGPEAASARNIAVTAFFRQCAARVAPSAWLARRAEAEGLGPVSVIRHGVPPGRPRVGGGPFLFLGTVAWHKGPDLVVRAWRRMYHTGTPALSLHGPVVDPEAAAGHPVGPPLDRQGVRQALAHATALVLGSRWPENAPLVILEARAAGCPVIAPDIGGIPEILEHGRDGLLYPPGDEAALAEALRAVLQRPWSVRQPPSPEEQTDQIISLYHDVTGISL